MEERSIKRVERPTNPPQKNYQYRYARFSQSTDIYESTLASRSKKTFREESMHDYARSLERLINKPRGN